MRINGEDYPLPVEWRDEPLVSYLRDSLSLTGTKFGCGKGVCGAGTVHIDGVAVRSRVVPAATVERAVSTVNFDSYYAPLSVDMPPMDIELVESALPPSGAGEASFAPAAAAIANAVYRATGVRHRQLPIRIAVG